MTLNLHRQPKILIFDSGAGGLSVAQKIVKNLPSAHIIYAADNAFYPYGLKEDSALTDRIVKQVELWHRKVKPDLVVIACNTASTLALDTLRAEFTCPFVGVVPAIKPAALLTNTGVIGVLATPATISRTYTQELIDDFAQHHEVILFGSDVIVEVAEEKLASGKTDIHRLNKELKLFFERPNGDKIDTVVLACTHFPLIKPEMAELADENIQWIDSGQAIANRVTSLINAELSKSSDALKIEFLFSSPRRPHSDLTKRYKSFILDFP